MNSKIAVIGGGPAGIIAAGIAGSRGKDVYLIEKNKRLGRKLYITGKGRCNVTNAAPIDEFFDFINTNNTFLYSSLYSFTNEDIINILNKYGVETVVERGNRVFPKSNKSSDVLKAFEIFLADNNVKTSLNKTVSNFYFSDNKFMLEIDNVVHEFDKVILATGGKSYPGTGSTGDGYNFAKRLGHKIIDLKPSLVPIEVYEDWIKDLQGVSLKNVRLNAYSNNKLIHSEFGDMLITHFGISGPIVLSISNYLHPYSNDEITFTIDLKPALEEDKLDKRILRDFETYNNKQLKNALGDLLLQKFIPLVMELSQVDPEKIINQITKEERSRLIHIIKNIPLTFKEFRPIEQAIITSGGINTKEINPSTMESKIVPNLYFAGEIIDVDAMTGGYNLQIAYSTGYIAGINV